MPAWLDQIVAARGERQARRRQRQTRAQSDDDHRRQHRPRRKGRSTRRQPGLQTRPKARSDFVCGERNGQDDVRENKTHLRSLRACGRQRERRKESHLRRDHRHHVETAARSPVTAQTEHAEGGDRYARYDPDRRMAGPDPRRVEEDADDLAGSLAELEQQRTEGMMREVPPESQLLVLGRKATDEDVPPLIEPDLPGVYVVKRVAPELEVPPKQKKETATKPAAAA